MNQCNAGDIIAIAIIAAAILLGIKENGGLEVRPVEHSGISRNLQVNRQTVT